MKIERLDPAVSALQYLARVPIPQSGVAQAAAANQAGMNLEQQNRDSASNSLKARISRLDKLNELSGAAGRLLGSLKKKAENESTQTLSEEADAAYKLFSEMAEELNLDGPPIFPPLPSPLARSLHILKGYMGQISDQALPAASTKEGKALELAAQTFLGEEGIFKTLKRIGEGKMDTESAAREYSRLTEKSVALIKTLEESSVDLRKAEEWNPLAGQPFEVAA
jgi:hypothetical protein